MGGGIQQWREAAALWEGEEVVAETRQAMEVAFELGSILVGCSNQVVASTSPENIEAMMETIDAHR